MFARSNARSIRVLGIDPGLTRCGYAVVDGRGGGAAVGGVDGRDPHSRRRSACRSGWPRCAPSWSTCCSSSGPHVVAVEQVFFQVNVRTAMSVGQASGLALCEAAAAGCEVVQYTPNQVKDAVAGYGGADKHQVQKMVQARLKLDPAAAAGRRCRRRRAGAVPPGDGAARRSVSPCRSAAGGR